MFDRPHRHALAALGVAAGAVPALDERHRARQHICGSHCLCPSNVRGNVSDISSGNVRGVYVASVIRKSPVLSALPAIPRGYFPADTGGLSGRGAFAPVCLEARTPAVLNMRSG